MASLGSDEILRRMRKACNLPFSDHEFEGVIADLKAGKLQAFWNDDAIVLTEICVSPRRRFLNIFMAAGTLKGVFELEPKVVKFARDNGITQAQTQGRLGWSRHLKARGWKKVAEIYQYPEEHWKD